MDLLQKLISGEGRKVEPPGPETEDKGAVELNLGLSLGGRFSGDKNKLARASSVIDLSVAQPDESLPFIGNKLNRWSSLPAKTPWLEFPEFGFCPPGRQDCRGSTQCEKTETKRQKLAGGFEGSRISVQRENGEGIGEGTARFPLDLPCRVRTFPSGETTTLREDLGFLGNFPETSQRSSTSGVSDPETQTSQGFNRHMEMKCPDKRHPVRGCSVRADAVPSKMMMGELPYVCTRVGGQNGKKIEGFLYKYDKGEEIRIVCACHGNFLSPAEFVKHGGGGDVEHPLRHIVVNPFPPFLRCLIAEAATTNYNFEKKEIRQAGKRSLPMAGHAI